jgi:hypothetical protein
LGECGNTVLDENGISLDHELTGAMTPTYLTDILAEEVLAREICCYGREKIVQFLLPTYG